MAKEVKQIQYRPKPKKCKQCEKLFNPYNPLQIVCSPNCASEWNSEKQVKKRVKEMKRGLLTHSDHLNALQIVFNNYIRKRDKGQPCISCGTFVDKGHASHYFSVGAYPNLRFNEFNVHLSCIECNLHQHGNSIEYGLRLPKRIGQDEFDRLVLEKDEPLKLTIPEIKILIQKYKKLIKDA
jgi:hypothetical protein